MKTEQIKAIVQSMGANKVALLRQELVEALRNSDNPLSCLQELFAKVKEGEISS